MCLVHFSRVGLDCRRAPALDHLVLGVRAYLNNFISLFRRTFDTDVPEIRRMAHAFPQKGIWS
jgi:hypothetical protein